MLFQRFRAWIDQYRRRKIVSKAETEIQLFKDKGKNVFSPITYRNPYMIYMHKIIANVINQKKISYQQMELVIIDAEENKDQDDEDIQIVLDELNQQLNYLLMVTDRPEKYKTFADEMYEENGLIVQQIPKTVCQQARGNVILDFERSSGFFRKNTVDSKAIYLPIYKRPWEISENLDILVPVGYNTLVVGGILPADWLEYRYMNERDRLDREFRKG